MGDVFLTSANTYSTPFNGLIDKTINNTTTEGSLMPMSGGAGNPTLAPGWLVPGRTVRIILSGVYSTATIAGNVTYRIYLGGTVVATGTVAALLGLATNQEWGLNISIACRAAGVSGLVMAGGSVWYQTALNVRAFQGISPLSAATIDTTQALTPDITVQWSAVGSNSMTTKLATIELLQP